VDLEGAAVLRGQRAFEDLAVLRAVVIDREGGAVARRGEDIENCGLHEATIGSGT